MTQEIIENILIKLPIKEAVRTSVLSSKWKSSWASIPDLVFTGKISESELIRSVDSVLLLHQGSILKFELVSRQLACDEAINRWLLALSKNGLKDLRLIFYIFKDCLVPSSLFSCHKLERLEISGCTINAPECFHGLELLRHLTLGTYILEGVTIEKFVSSCPLLESLTLFGVKHDRLIIRAPNLKQLILLESFNDLMLETPKLSSATIFAFPRDFGDDGCKGKLLHTIGALSNIEELRIDSQFCKYLATRLIPKKLPVTFFHLKKLSIHLNSRSKMVETALCIFRNAPNLKTLGVFVPSQIVWEEQRITSISILKKLEVVVILGFADNASLLAFSKFIFSTTPKLEKLVIDREDINRLNLDDQTESLMEVGSLPRLSSKAEIVLDESSKY
ncbi:F-box family protein [Rhynchospora pubera]|uniref:F-box family protein n=1 Tax=Rhynchospora pubera TaxID=906938 RepID=A0AAV8HEV4_9POAL|nr:F-box family protein [Rhynchospora pubera]